MQTPTPNKLLNVLKLLACLLILKVTAGILLLYPDYLPPNFESDFLRGRESYFFGTYQWAFFIHIASAPPALLLGMLLLSQRFRTRFTRWHRILGRIQLANVLLLVTPSGIWMAFYAETGTVAGLGLTGMALATAFCHWRGWRSALKRQFTKHRPWMCRSFLMLCSAVVLRLTAGLFTVLEVDGAWTYPLATWTSWLVPLAAYEIIRATTRARYALVS